MKRTVVWKNRFILFGMMVMALLFISGCSGDDLTPVTKSIRHQTQRPRGLLLQLKIRGYTTEPL